MLLTKDEKAQPITAVWRNGGFSASYDSFVVGSSAVLRLNFCAKNPPLRQAANRYKQAEKKDIDTMTMKFLLHKDKEEKYKNADAQNCTFASPDTQAVLQLAKEQFSCQRTAGN